MYLIVIIVVVVFSAILYIYMVYPGNTHKMRDFGKWYYAHRGLHDINKGCPENSMPAFKNAVESGYGIELDVRLTKDGQVIVFHDETLTRACGIDAKVSDMEYRELKNLRLFNTNHYIPLLIDVLNYINGRVPLIVEIKTCVNRRDLCSNVASLLDGYKGLYCIESFDPRIVKWFKINRPGVVRGQLSSLFAEPCNISPLEAFVVSNLLTNFMSRPHFIAYKHQDCKNISFRFLRRVLRASTVAWTIRSEKEMEPIKNLFDTYIFEGFKP